MTLDNSIAFPIEKNEDEFIYFPYQLVGLRNILICGGNSHATLEAVDGNCEIFVEYKSLFLYYLSGGC